MWRKYLLVVGAVVTLIWWGSALPEETEHPRITTRSPEFERSATAVLKLLTEKDFAADLQTPPLASEASDHYRLVLQKLKSHVPYSIKDVSVGDSGVTYDVILQPGHYARTVGATGAQGPNVSEQSLVAYITDAVRDALVAGRLRVLVIPADGSANGLQSKMFLAIHADGGVPPCTTGPSLGYERGASPMAMHAIGVGLATAMDIPYDKFRKDNYTANEAGYYMFRRIKAPTKGLLEVGEITCADTEHTLLESANIIANNLATAVRFVVGQ